MKKTERPEVGKTESRKVRKTESNSRSTPPARVESSTKYSESVPADCKLLAKHQAREHLHTQASQQLRRDSGERNSRDQTQQPRRG